MGAHTLGVLLVAGAGFGVLVWLLAKLGHILAKIAEAVAAAAVVFAALWLLVKALGWTLRQVGTHWRTSLTLLATALWWHWLGWISLVAVLGAVAVSLAVWRLVNMASCDRWAWRHVRTWWLR